MCLVEIKPAANQRAMMLDVVEWDPSLQDYRPVQKPKLLPACQYPAVENQEVLADTSPHVRQARSAVQELLLLNHPVDCPICDQAGECKLQDYWLEHQTATKRMRDEPVHKPKAVQFGPTIVYDAERCVMCTRCIRFMEEVAKDPVLDMRERGNLNEIFVAPGRQLEGHYTLMTEHVCPVGALTSRDFRFKARVWFLKSAKTVCQGCATGCNAHLDFDPRSNKAHRYRPRDNEEVNAYWMCDEGMLSYRSAHEGRITHARVTGQRVAVESAFSEAQRRFRGAAANQVAIVLSAQHSLEDNWALRDIASHLGTNAFYVAAAPPGYSDTILIDSDKNSNRAGVKELSPSARSFEDLLADIRAGRTTHVIALGASGIALNSDHDAEALRQLLGFVVVASHESALCNVAHVVLPATSWAEQSGTYVNKKGIRQQTEQALSPQGESKPAWSIVRQLGQSLGFDATWATLRDVRARMGLAAAARDPKAQTQQTTQTTQTTVEGA